jgi:hypothetical protein
VVAFVFSVGAAAKPVDVTKPPGLRLVLNDVGGTISLFTPGPKDRAVSLFDTQDNGETTALYLRVNSAMYKLRRGGGVSVRAYETAQGGALHYVVKDQAEVIAEFTFLETIPGGGADAFRVDLRVRNISGASQMMALKGIFDTVWGERDKTFFSTAAVNAITSEFQITTPAVHQWVRTSENGKSLRFLFFGPGITTPDAVTLANKDILSSASWDPGSNAGRSFTSISSVNNPAVELRWVPMDLEQNAIMHITFFITVTTGSLAPSVVAFHPPGGIPDARDTGVLNLTGQDGGSLPEYTPPALGRDTTPASAVTRGGAPGAVGAVTPPYSGFDTPTIRMDPEKEPPSPPKPLPFSVEMNQKEDIEYARSLIDQIKRLTSGPNGIHGMNQAEVARMNRELDVVLARLGWQL